MEKGFFGDLFDFNQDGKLDTFERTMDYMAFNDLMMEGSEDDEVDDEVDELEAAGLDYDELAFMDEEERREALEDAGLDAEDYIF